MENELLGEQSELSEYIEEEDEILDQVLEQEQEEIEQEEQEKVVNISEEFNKYYRSILESYTQKQYRKARDEIMRMDYFSECTDYWKLLHLKIKCNEKIIERKIERKPEAKYKASIESWLLDNNEEIQIWFKEVVDYAYDEQDAANKVEILITFILTQCLNYAKHSMNQKYLNDCITFLALGNNLIKRSSDFITSPDTLFVIQQLYLYTSALYITNENYLTAKKHLILILKLTFKELEIRIDNEYHSLFEFESLHSNDQEQLTEIFFNVVTAMYQLGICYENEGDLDKAHQAYKQCKWFGNVFLRRYKGLLELISDIERRMRLRIELCDFIKSEESNLGEPPVKEPPKIKYFYNELEKIKKFEKLKEFIERLNLNEVDDDEFDLLCEVNKKPFSQRVNVATKTIHVLNYMMSSKFKDVIKGMNKIEINNLENDTKRSIQKRIIMIKNNQRLKLLKEEKEREKEEKEREKEKEKEKEKEREKEKEKERISMRINLKINNKKTKKKEILPKMSKDIEYMTTMANDTPLLTQTSFNVSTSNTRPHSKTRPWTAKTITTNDGSSIKYRLRSRLNGLNSSKFIKNDSKLQTTYDSIEITQNNLNSNQNLLKTSQKTVTPYKPKHYSNAPEKIVYSSYIFNKSYRNKIDFCNKQFDKELKFQKQLLSCKTEEKRKVEPDLNEKKRKKKCEIFFTNELENQKKIVAEKKEKDVDDFFREQIGLYKKRKGAVQLIELESLLNQRMGITLGNETKKEELNTTKINKIYLNNLECELETLGRSEEYLEKKLKTSTKKKGKYLR